MQAQQAVLDETPIPPLHKRWRDALACLDIAFQPIVNIHTGACVAYEALVRNTELAGFGGIFDFFDASHDDGILRQVDSAIQALAIGKFARLPHCHTTKLFLNVDGRAMTSVPGVVARFNVLAGEHGLAGHGMVAELSERFPLHGENIVLAMPASARHGSCQVAIDDFGTGYSGFPLLYFVEPNFIKIDRFFVNGIAIDSKKKLFVGHMVHVAHMLGAQVIAEGVETEAEFFVSREIGCDLVQGYLIQRPTIHLNECSSHYPIVEDLNRHDRRRRTHTRSIVGNQIQIIAPLHINDTMETVFERFRVETQNTFFPVLLETGQPVGIVHEEKIKEYTYSRFGKELMSNKAFGHHLRNFTMSCPTADIYETPEQLLATFSADYNTNGIIMVENGRYVGFLHGHVLLRLLHERNLAQARDQNPLTYLPGNNAVQRYLAKVLADPDAAYCVAYFDFDNFKPFNDKYGFRQGDRAITLFAEILAKVLTRENYFFGHIGGDDFFAGFKATQPADVLAQVQYIRRRFGTEVESFYDEETRLRGHFIALDRHGVEREIPLLSVSVGLVHLPTGRVTVSADDLVGRISDLKKQAKADPNGVACHIM